jgi:hypothetical protein
MLTTLLLTLRIASLLMATGHDATDAHLFAMACTRNATPLVSAERLCAVAFVESKHRARVVNAGGHCGAWQQHPQWSGMWGDDCYDDAGRLTCMQPGGAGVACEELVDVTVAARVASRHLTYLTRHYHDRALCRYAGATGQRCGRYTAAVARAERHLTR